MGWRLVAMAALAGLVTMGSASAATIVVDTTTDAIDGAGDCSLREAVLAANTDAAVDGCTAGDPGLDTIQLGAGHYDLTLTGTPEDADLSGDLDVAADLAIVGLGNVVTSIGNTVGERTFHVQAGVALTLSQLAVSDGFESTAGGAAVRVEDGGSLTVTDCRLIDGQAAEGGAIDGLNATITLTRTWISGNEASANGGGVAAIGGSLVLTDCAVVDDHSGARGGGIYARDAVITLVRSEVADNDASLEGAGLRVGGASTLTLRNVTIAGNQTPGSGGGALVTAGTDALFSNVTIAGNAADFDDLDGSGSGTGGGVFKSGSGTLTFQNTIIAGNTDDGSAPDCDGLLIVSGGHNLVQDTTECGFTPLASDQTGLDPLLEALANNGGYNETMALEPGSPARDAGDPATPGSGGTACESDDQRAVARPLGVACDAGAFEAAPVPTPTLTASDTPSATPGGATASPTETATPSATDTETPTTAATVTLTASPIATATATPTSTSTAAATTSPTTTVSETPSPTATADDTPSPSPTSTAPTATASPTPGCPATPASGCRTAAVAHKGALAVTNSVRSAGDALAWTWAKGSVTPKSDFGDPTATTDYDFCVYDGSGTLVAHTHAGAGGICGRHPCWKSTRHGFTYASPLRTADGLGRIALTEGLADGKARISLKAGGANLSLPTLPLATPLRVQLRNTSGVCWEATFSAPRKNDAKHFTAKSD